MEDLLHYAHCIKRETSSPHTQIPQLTLYHRDEYRHVKRLRIEKTSVFYTWLQKPQHWIIPARLQVKPFFVVHLRGSNSWHAWFQLLPGVFGCRDCPNRGMRFEKVDCLNAGEKRARLYISTNYCLSDGIEFKTFVSTQTHKCKRSVNRLFKGYLLIIYMKCRRK